MPADVRRVRLATLTTLKVGGPAELWTVDDEAGLRDACSEPFLVLGGGSNLLVSDAGVGERVVRLGRAFQDREALASAADGGGAADAWIGAATPLPGLVRRAQRLGLSGLEGLLGIPAVLGGAVAMNAGTRFGELSDTLQEVELFVGGRLERLAAAELRPSYRHAEIPAGAIVTRARLRLARSSPERVREAMARVDAARKGQPKTKSAGCAFKNPPGDSAGRLIDAAGLKGVRVGDAMVALEHGNFIVNLGGATAHDVCALLQRIQARLAEVGAPPLELEWRRWGFA